MSLNDSSYYSSYIEVSAAMNSLTFGWIDYSCFAMMLSVSAAVGIYFAFFSKKQETTTEYLLGGKTMGYFPVAMSLTASHLSGVTLLGIPSEIYQFGTQYMATILTTIFTCLLTAFIFIPVFHKLQLTSTFEYLELRFTRPVRQLASALNILSTTLYMPIVIYVPALAFSQVTGLALHYITPLICVVCIFYTTVGGLKAAIWTDTIQFIVTLVTLLVVFTLGLISVGGFGEVWRISGEGGRLIFFDMDPSPFARSSFWGMVIGLTSSWAAAIGLSQGTIQRILSVPSLTQGRISVLIMCVGFVIVKVLSIFSGLIMYAKYHDCDPISTKAVTRPDQMMPYYTMDVAGNIPGLPGFFLAALVSSALSSLSSALNTAAGTIWEDFISPWVPESESKQKTATNVMKVTVMVLGIICVGLVFVVEHLGEIFTMATSLGGVTSGTLLGLFTLGMLVPWSTSKGAIVGGTLGFLTTAFIIIGAQIHKINGNIYYEELPTATNNCPYPLNMTDWTKPTRQAIEQEDEPMMIFAISFLYYAFVGFVTVVFTGTVVSFATGSSDLTQLDRDHFSPIVQRFLPKEKYTKVALTATITLPKNTDKEKEAMSDVLNSSN